MRPHRRKPTRLPRPWDSLGKNTGVGCHFLLQCVKVKSEREVAQSCLTLRDPMDCSPPGSPVPGIFQARALEWGAIAFPAHTPCIKGKTSFRCVSLAGGLQDPTLDFRGAAVAAVFIPLSQDSAATDPTFKCEFYHR